MIDHDTLFTDEVLGTSKWRVTAGQNMKIKAQWRHEYEIGKKEIDTALFDADIPSC